MSFKKRKDKLINDLDKTEQVKDMNKTATEMNKDEAKPLQESNDTKPEENPKNRIDFNNFSETLFSGKSGNILKYFLKNEINNSNVRELQIAKIMEVKPEVQTIIKKLNFYLKRTKSGLSYEEYIDMKVQKGKFRSEFNIAEKEYLNKYNN